MFFRFVNTVLLVVIMTALQSQDFQKKNFRVFRTKEGLSNNHIWSVTQDAYGYLWVATERGLNRFDGSGFNQFYSDSSSESLPQDWVHNLTWINQDNLGVLTLAGFYIINSKTLEGYNLMIPADTLKHLSIVNKVYDVTVDKQENTFIITSTGFYHFNKKKLVFRYDHFSLRTIETQNVQFGWNVIQMNEHTLLLSTIVGPYVYNIANRNLQPVSTNDDPFFLQVAMPKEKFRIVYKDENSFITMPWSEEEMILFNTREKSKQTIEIPVTIRKKLDATPTLFRVNDSLMAMTFSNKGFCLIRQDRQTSTWIVDSTLYFENDFCTAVLMDKNNRLWVGTINGLYKQNRTGGRIEQLLLPGESVSLLKTISAITVANNKLFTATALEGLYVFSSDSLVFLQHLMTPEKDHSYISHLIKINEDSLMTARKAVVINTVSLDYKKIVLENITDAARIMGVVMKDSRGGIYFTKQRSDTVYFKGIGDKSFLPLRLPGLQQIPSISQMAEDNEHNLWFGGQGLIRFNDQLKKFDIFLDSFPAIKKRTKNISSNIVFDNKGNMYFGLADNGLIIYDVKGKKFSQITRSQGLPDNTILTLCLVGNKTLWIGTESGLANYDLVSKKVSAFGAADGMPIDPGTCHALYYDSSHGHLYAGFTHTIVRFDPIAMKKNETPPDLFVESIEISGKEALYHPGELVTVPYRSNNVIINFAAINFEDAPQQLFAYRFLKDGNEEWQELGIQRKIFLSNLPVGRHKLQIKAYIRNQSWPDQVKEILLTIRPPFWKTVWFYLIIGLLLAACLFYLHRLRIKQLTQKANVDKQLAQTEMKALHAQMNPHFIFNCLNSIREMILNNENEQASLYLSKFARLIRITLNQSAKQFVSLADTIDYLKRYIEMEKIRSSHFAYTIDIASDLNPDEIMVPPMLIQPFIENAIWHGAVPKKNMDIHITFRKKRNELVCIVDDNGIGIEESLKKKEDLAHEPSVGIANIKQRIALLNEKYNFRSTVNIEDKLTLPAKNGTGTIVTLHLPIKTHETLWTT